MESVTVTWTLAGVPGSGTFAVTKSRLAIPPIVEVSDWFRGRLHGTCIAELAPTQPASSKFAHHLFQGSSFIPCPPFAAVLQGWPPGWQLVASPDGTSVWLICPNDAVGVQASPDSVAVSVGPPQGPAPNPRDAQMDLPQDPHERRKALFSELAPAVREKLQLDDAVVHSTSPTWMADAICKHILALVGPTAVVSDGVACVGGDSIRFASRFAHVNAVEADQHRATKAYHNLKLCGLDSKAYVYQGDLWKLGPCLEQDVVFLGPPEDAFVPTASGLVDIQIASHALVDVCRRLSFGSRRTKFIVVKAPVHFNQADFGTSVATKLPGSHYSLTEVGQPVKALLITLKLPS